MDVFNTTGGFLLTVLTAHAQLLLSLSPKVPIVIFTNLADTNNLSCG